MADSMDWFKKHVDTVVVLGGILASILWMNGRFNDINSKFHELEKDITIIKTVLFMKGIIPPELCNKSDKSPVEKG